MELHQRITSLVQKETDRLLKEFLNDNPDLLQKYVDNGVAAVGFVLTPLNAFMRHLLVLKGLNPDEVPGERLRKQLNEAITSLFDQKHEKDFDDDYDFSWVRKKFEETRTHMKGLTEDRFKQLTDLDKLPSIGPGRYPTIEEEQEFHSEHPSTRLPDKEIRVRSEDNPIEKLRGALKEIIKETANKSALSDKFNPGDAIKKVEGIFEEINKVSKKGIKTSKKRVNKGKGTRVNRVPATVEEQATHSAKKNTLKENIKIKCNRAKDLVDDMVKRGLVTDNKDAIQEQLQQILLMDDDAVDSLKRVVTKHTPLPGDNQFKGSFRRVQK